MGTMNAVMLTFGVSQKTYMNLSHWKRIVLSYHIAQETLLSTLWGPWLADTQHSRSKLLRSITLKHTSFHVRLSHQSPHLLCKRPSRDGQLCILNT